MTRLWPLWLILSVGAAACDDVGEGTPDAWAFADAQPDIDGGPFPDAMQFSGPITVRVYGPDGLPLAGAAVLVARFNSLSIITATNQDGTAHPIVDIGDTVTALYKTTDGGTQRRVMTWVSVDPGDQLTMGVPVRSSGAVLGEMTVTTPGSFTGATTYHASSGCEAADVADPPTTLSYSLFAGCHADPTHVPVWLEARDAAGHTLAYATRTDAAVVAQAASVSFDAWRTDAVPFASSIEHLPAGLGPVNRHLGLLAPGNELFDVPVASAAPASATAEVPVGLAPSWIYADQIVEGDGSQGRWRVVAGAAPIPTSVSFDYANGLLAPLGSIGIDNFDLTTLFTSWTFQTGTGGSTLDDAVLLTYHFSSGTWTMVMGPGSMQARLPPLPEELGEFRPTALPDAVTVVVIDSNNADYKQLRRVISGSAQDGEALWPIVTSPLRSGTVKLSERVFIPAP
jgi:hypothetical protein